MLLRTCLEACAIAILFIAMLAADLFAGSSALMKAVTAGKEGDTALTQSACTFNVKPVSTSIAPPNHATCIGSYHKSHYTWHGFRRRHTSKRCERRVCAAVRAHYMRCCHNRKQKIGSI